VTAAVELSVVVVSYNTRALLRRCLASLGAAAAGTPHEVVVVDNASRDGSLEMVAREFPAVRAVANPANVGFARAANQGIRESGGALVALLNSDAEATAGSLTALAAVLAGDPRIGAAGPQTRFPDGRVCQSCFRFPSLTRPAVNFRWVRRLAGEAFSLSYPPGDPRLAEGGEVDWLSGACLLLRRKALDAVGLLDERFFMYFEDTDLCRRLHRAGWAVRYVPRIHVVHHVGQSSRGEAERLRVELRRSALVYFRTHHRAPVVWAMRALMLAGALLRLASGPRGRETERQIIRLALGRCGSSS
jgi:N-acetylglucosaminyl-diphospho-decaprenol L-rhamnosyltransferase